nr:cupin domain-containing protein [Aliikangiella sp. G2MR2-5]
MNGFFNGVGCERFTDEHLGCRPLLLTRTNSDFYNDILSLNDINNIFSSKRLIENDIRVFKAGKKIAYSEISYEDRSADKSKIFELFKSGATLVFENIGRYHLPLGQFIAHLENEFHVRMRANAFLTPAGSQGFKPHFDSHDVFVLQIYGHKEWLIGNNPIELPDDMTSETRYQAAIENSEILATEVLKKGDLLYLPRGFVHSAKACESTSLHITISMRGHTGVDLLKKSLSQIFENSVEMRKYINHKKVFDNQSYIELLTNEIKKVQYDKLSTELYQDYLLQTFPVAYQQVERIFSPQELLHDSLLEVNPYMVWQAFYQGDFIRLIFDGKEMRLPKAAQNALQYISEQSNFRPSELPDFDEKNALMLCEVLYSNGYLKFAERNKLRETCRDSL